MYRATKPCFLFPLGSPGLGTGFQPGDQVPVDCIPDPENPPDCVERTDQPEPEPPEPGLPPELAALHPKQTPPWADPPAPAQEPPGDPQPETTPTAHNPWAEQPAPAPDPVTELPYDPTLEPQPGPRIPKNPNGKGGR